MKLRQALQHRVDALSIRTRLIRELGVRHSVRRWRADSALDALAPARRVAFDSGMWAEAASAVGASMSEIAPRLFQFRRDGLTVHVLGQRTPFADPVSIKLASEKHLAYALLDEAGIPIPYHLVIRRSDTARALRFLREGGPCVVKPAAGGGGGQGVTASVDTPEQMSRAVKRAGLTSAEVVIEREVPGDHYRFLLLDGELLDVVKRRRPQVVGDGVSTIEHLMFAEYNRRLRDPGPGGIKPFAVDLDSLFALRRQGLRPTSVPAAGNVVTVKGATNVSGPAECSTFTGTVSSDVLADVREAAAVLGVRLGGVDVLASSVEGPGRLGERGGVVLEVNPIPGLFHHYVVADPSTATRVAVPILEALFAQRAPSGT